MKINVAKVYQTCFGCPSQWSGVTSMGSSIYIRYRYGRLSVVIDEEVILSESVGDSLDGVMDFDEMAGHTESILDFNGVEWVGSLEDLNANNLES